MFACKACQAKDADIMYLRTALAELQRATAAEREEWRKDLLAVADRNAANQRAPRKAQADQAPNVLTTPAQIRGVAFKPATPLTALEIEAAFKGAFEGQSASGAQPIPAGPLPSNYYRDASLGGEWKPRPTQS